MCRLPGFGAGEKSAPLWSRASRSSKEAESKMDKQEQTDQDRCRGHVLFAKSCSPCPLPVWPVITERLGLSADCRWPCVDPHNLQSNHMMAALDPRATGSNTVTPQNKRTFKSPHCSIAPETDGDFRSLSYRRMVNHRQEMSVTLAFTVHSVIFQQLQCHIVVQANKRCTSKSLRLLQSDQRPLTRGHLWLFWLSFIQKVQVRPCSVVRES